MKKTFYLRTFGCQMNFHDSEHIAGVLHSVGFTPVSDQESAHIIIYNTCAVRKSAEDKLWGNLGRLGSEKKNGQVIAVCGCVAEMYGQEIISRFPAVDLVFGIASLPRLPELLSLCMDRTVCEVGGRWKPEIESMPSLRVSVAKAWVPVSHGCNKGCAYCVVPLVRGREVSRPMEDILDEVERLSREGVLEIVLLGQNVNSYGSDIGGDASFSNLLRRVGSLDGIRRVRFETSHPADLTDDIIDAIRDVSEVCEHLHLPIQSGSDAVLARMGRGYTVRKYEEIVTIARKKVPGLSITTDIIVGFPGEEESDFQKTVEFVKKIGFDQAFIFKYSQRKGTPAEKFSRQVSEDEKTRRILILNKIQREATANAMKKLVGKSVEVLIEGKAKRGDFLAGRARGNQIVLLPPHGLREGMLVMAKITEAGIHSLKGRVEGII